MIINIPKNLHHEMFLWAFGIFMSLNSKFVLYDQYKDILQNNNRFVNPERFNIVNRSMRYKI